MFATSGRRKLTFLKIPRDGPPSKSRNLTGIPGGIPPLNGPILRNLEESRAGFRLEIFVLCLRNPGRNPASKTLRLSLYMRTCARTALVRAFFLINQILGVHLKSESRISKQS